MSGAARRLRETRGAAPARRVAPQLRPDSAHAEGPTRRSCLAWLAGAAALPGAPVRAAALPADPYRSLQWPALVQEFLGDAPAETDPRVQVFGPSFAADPMNVPVTVDAAALGAVERLVVWVDRNPIRRVLEYRPLRMRATISLRFKLEQASPVRVAALTADGRWHLGHHFVDSAGGGCTVAGATRKDGSWSRTLGEVATLVARPAPDPASAARLRVRVMHPMDTGLVGGIPAFYLNRLALVDAAGSEWMRLATFEPVSENPVFSLDFARLPDGPLRLVGGDNNGNRIDQPVEIR